MNRKKLLIGVAVLIVLVIVIAVPCALLLGKKEREKTPMERALSLLEQTPLVDGLVNCVLYCTTNGKGNMTTQRNMFPCITKQYT